MAAAAGHLDPGHQRLKVLEDLPGEHLDLQGARVIGCGNEGFMFPAIGLSRWAPGAQSPVRLSGRRTRSSRDAAGCDEIDPERRCVGRNVLRQMSCTSATVTCPRWVGNGPGRPGGAVSRLEGGYRPGTDTCEKVKREHGAGVSALGHWQAELIAPTCCRTVGRPTSGST